MRRLITFRGLTIANHLLPAIVNDDPTGLGDGDIDQLSSFRHNLMSEVNAFCDTLTPNMFFHDLVLADVSEAAFRMCDVTKLRALCVPVTVMVTTYGGAAPDANLYDYTSFTN